MHIMQWINCCYLKVFIPCRSFICFMLCLLHQTRDSWALSVKKVASWHNSRFQKLRNYFWYCFGIQAGNANKKISECLVINLGTDSYSYWWKPNTQSTSSCLEWSWAMVMLGFYSSSHMASHSTLRPTLSNWSW